MKINLVLRKWSYVITILLLALAIFFYKKLLIDKRDENKARQEMKMMLKNSANSVEVSNMIYLKESSAYDFIIAYANTTNICAKVNGIIYYGDGTNGKLYPEKKNILPKTISAFEIWSARHDYRVSGVYRVTVKIVIHFPKDSVATVAFRDFYIRN